VLYEPFRAVWTNMPYAKRWTRWDKRKESELVLDNNVHIVPALASLQSMVGQAIAGAIIDEINFMTRSSKIRSRSRAITAWAVSMTKPTSSFPTSPAVARVRSLPVA
jgi:hypothetical protein